jgi:hypothetical protein
MKWVVVAVVGRPFVARSSCSQDGNELAGCMCSGGVPGCVYDACDSD